MQLTHDNYFTIENKFISNSKMSDFLKDPLYFKKKHITGEITTRETDAMLLGRCVDLWLTRGEKSFRDKYLVVSRRSRKSETPWSCQINESQMRQVEHICEKVEEFDLYRDIKENFDSQQILWYVMAKEAKCQWYGLCGIPDFIRISQTATGLYPEGKIVKKATIVDLKTAATVDPNKYYWHCEDYGYFRQQAMYQYLINKTYGIEFTHMISYHLVIEKDANDINKCALFKLAQGRILHEVNKLEDLYNQIVLCKFEKHNLSWNDAVPIGESINEETNTIQKVY